ncbi:MAG: hypothetical protein K6G92_03805 [Bacteroidaceae bacterium]|nr:hypothetical protein [Bacteroidaceae bacterium]
MNASYSENVNVQQAENLTGQVNSQARTVADIVGKAVNQPTADEQGRSERRCVLASMPRMSMRTCRSMPCAAATSTCCWTTCACSSATSGPMWSSWTA